VAGTARGGADGVASRKRKSELRAERRLSIENFTERLAGPIETDDETR